MTKPGRATVDRTNYNAYINSDAWRAVRRRYWTSKLPNDCYCCGTPWRPGFHLHHRTYKNLGNERLMDLAPVCPACHRTIHNLHHTHPIWRRRGLWATTKHVRRANQQQPNP